MIFPIESALLEAVDEWVHVRLLSDAHPYGSTTAAESSFDVELKTLSVFIDCDWDSLPTSLIGTLTKRGCDVRLKFTLCHYYPGTPIVEYDVEMLND